MLSAGKTHAARERSVGKCRSWQGPDSALKLVKQEVVQTGTGRYSIRRGKMFSCHHIDTLRNHVSDSGAQREREREREREP